MQRHACLACVRGNRQVYGLFGAGDNHVRRRTSPNAFVTVQVALTFVLLAGAGLMVNSLIRMVGADPGFDLHNLAYMEVRLAEEGYSAKTAPEETSASDISSDIAPAKPANYGKRTKTDTKELRPQLAYVERLSENLAVFG